jgi:hypothetical protein
MGFLIHAGYIQGRDDERRRWEARYREETEARKDSAQREAESREAVARFMRSTDKSEK